MGSGLGQSFFLAVTLSSGQVEWSASPAVILSKFTVVSSFEESSVWRLMQDRHSSRANSLFPGYTCLVSEEWPRVGNGLDNYSSRVDSFSLGYTLFSVGGMAQGGSGSNNYSLGQTHSL